MEQNTKFSKWLELTPQQAIIVGIIQKLQSQNINATPIIIEKEYLKDTNIFIQKSNLFTQLKILQEKNIITKSPHSVYYLHPEGILQIISKRKNDLSKELKEIQDLSLEAENIINKLIPQNTISVKYLSESEFFSQLTKHLDNANSFYLGCDFPHFGYSFTLCRTSQQTAYIEMLNKKIHDTNFSHYCLCTYKNDALFYQLNEKYSNKQFIEEELKRINQTTIEKAIQLPNIDIRKTRTSFDFALIENSDNINVLFMILKDTNGIINGGLFINSHETIQEIKKNFLTQLSTNNRLKSQKDFPNITFKTDIIKKIPANKKIIIFDVNRIFTKNHTTIELSKLIDKEKEVSELIKGEIEGNINLQEAIEKSARLLDGLDTKKIKNLANKIELTKNVKEGIKKLKKEDYHIAAISTGFSHIITPICTALGIDDIYCNVLEEKNGKITGIVAEKNVVTDKVKYYIAKYLLEKYSVPENNSVSIGDGYSDLDMLKATRYRIAFNPSNKLKELYKKKSSLITHLIEKDDFQKLVDVIIDCIR